MTQLSGLLNKDRLLLAHSLPAIILSFVFTIIPTIALMMFSKDFIRGSVMPSNDFPIAPNTYFSAIDDHTAVDFQDYGPASLCLQLISKEVNYQLIVYPPGELTNQLKKTLDFFIADDPQSSIKNQPQQLNQKHPSESTNWYDSLTNLFPSTLSQSEKSDNNMDHDQPNGLKRIYFLEPKSVAELKQMSTFAGLRQVTLEWDSTLYIPPVSENGPDTINLDERHGEGYQIDPDIIHAAAAGGQDNDEYSIPSGFSTNGKVKSGTGSYYDYKLSGKAIPGWNTGQSPTFFSPFFSGFEKSSIVMEDSLEQQLPLYFDHSELAMWQSIVQLAIHQASGFRSTTQLCDFKVNHYQINTIPMPITRSFNMPEQALQTLCTIIGLWSVSLATYLIVYVSNLVRDRLNHTTPGLIALGISPSGLFFSALTLQLTALAPLALFCTLGFCVFFSTTVFLPIFIIIMLFFINTLVLFTFTSIFYGSILSARIGTMVVYLVLIGTSAFSVFKRPPFISWVEVMAFPVTFFRICHSLQWISAHQGLYWTTLSDLFRVMPGQTSSIARLSITLTISPIVMFWILVYFDQITKQSKYRLTSSWLEPFTSIGQWIKCSSSIPSQGHILFAAPTTNLFLTNHHHHPNSFHHSLPQQSNNNRQQLSQSTQSATQGLDTFFDVSQNLDQAEVRSLASSQHCINFSEFENDDTTQTRNHKRKKNKQRLQQNNNDLTESFLGSPPQHQSSYFPSLDNDEMTSASYPDGSVYIRLCGPHNDELFPHEEHLYTGLYPQGQQFNPINSTHVSPFASPNAPSPFVDPINLPPELRPKIQPPSRVEAANPSITIKHISKRYDSKGVKLPPPPPALGQVPTPSFDDSYNLDDRSVLRDVNLRFYRGQIHTILGRNSSGKSTLLNIIGQLVPRTSGSMFLHPPIGPNAAMAEYRPSFGFCWHDNHLLSSLTVRENIEVFSSLKLAAMGRRGIVSKEEERAEIHRVLNMAKLTSAFDNKEDAIVDTLSGGQKRKLSVAVALLHHPDIVLLDSPTVGADVQAQLTIWEMLQMSKTNKTIIISTLSFQEAQIGDRISILKDGRVTCCGSVEWLKEQYHVGDYLLFIDKQEKETASATSPSSQNLNTSSILASSPRASSPLVPRTTSHSNLFTSSNLLTPSQINNTLSGNSTGNVFNATIPLHDRLMSIPHETLGFSLHEALLKQLDTQLSLSYSIFPQWSDHIPTLLNFLDENKIQLGISTISLSLLTLQYVFEQVHLDESEKTTSMSLQQQSPSSNNPPQSTLMFTSQEDLQQSNLYVQATSSLSLAQQQQQQQQNEHSVRLLEQAPSDSNTLMEPIYIPWYERQLPKKTGVRLLISQMKMYTKKRSRILWANRQSSLLPAFIIFTIFFVLLYFLSRLDFPPGQPIAVNYSNYPSQLPVPYFLPPSRDFSPIGQLNANQFTGDLTKDSEKIIEPNVVPTIFGDYYDPHDVCDWFFKGFLDIGVSIKKIPIELPVKAYYNSRYGQTQSQAMALFSGTALGESRLLPQQIGFELLNLEFTYGTSVVRLYGDPILDFSDTVTLQSHFLKETPLLSQGIKKAIENGQGNDNEYNISPWSLSLQDLYQAIQNEQLSQSSTHSNTTGTDNQSNLDAFFNLRMFHQKMKMIKPKDRTTSEQNALNRFETLTRLDSFVNDLIQKPLSTSSVLLPYQFDRESYLNFFNHFTAPVSQANLLSSALNEPDQNEVLQPVSSFNMNYYYNTTNPYAITSFISRYYETISFLETNYRTVLNDDKTNSFQQTNFLTAASPLPTVVNSTVNGVNKCGKDGVEDDTARCPYLHTDQSWKNLNRSGLTVALNHYGTSETNTSDILPVAFDSMVFFTYLAVCLAVLTFLHTEESEKITHLHHLMGGSASRFSYWIGYLATDILIFTLTIVSTTTIAQTLKWIIARDVPAVDPISDTTPYLIQRILQLILVSTMLAIGTISLAYISSVKFPQQFSSQLAFFIVIQSLTLTFRLSTTALSDTDHRSFWASPQLSAFIPTSALLSLAFSCDQQIFLHGSCAEQTVDTGLARFFTQPPLYSLGLLIWPAILIFIIIWRQHFKTWGSFDGTSGKNVMKRSTGTIESPSRWVSNVITTAAASANPHRLTSFFRAEPLTRGSLVIRKSIRDDKKANGVSYTVSHVAPMNPNVVDSKRSILLNNHCDEDGTNNNVVTFLGVRKVHVVELGFFFWAKAIIGAILKWLFPLLSQCFRGTGARSITLGKINSETSLKLRHEQEQQLKRLQQQSLLVPELWDNDDDSVFLQCMSTLEFMHLISPSVPQNNANLPQSLARTDSQPHLQQTPFETNLVYSVSTVDSILTNLHHSTPTEFGTAMGLSSAGETGNGNRNLNNTKGLTRDDMMLANGVPAQAANDIANFTQYLGSNPILTNFLQANPRANHNQPKLNLLHQSAHQSHLLQSTILINDANKAALDQLGQIQQSALVSSTTTTNMHSSTSSSASSKSSQTPFFATLLAASRQRNKLISNYNTTIFDDENDDMISDKISPHHNKSVVALNELYLSIKKNTVFCICGSNGAGKSTLLQLLTNETALSPSLDTLGTSTIFIGDSNIARNPEAMLHQVSYCPQYDRLNLELSARSTFELYGGLCGYDMNSQDTIDFLQDLLFDLGLFEVADLPSATYTADQRRLVTIGISLLGNHPIVVLDEPTAYSDAVSRRRVHNLLQSLIRTRTLIFTSHMIEEVDFLADQIAVLGQGHLHLFGPKSLLKEGRSVVNGEDVPAALNTSSSLFTSSSGVRLTSHNQSHFDPAMPFGSFLSSVSNMTSISSLPPLTVASSIQSQTLSSPPSSLSSHSPQLQKQLSGLRVLSPIPRLTKRSPIPISQISLQLLDGLRTVLKTSPFATLPPALTQPPSVNGDSEGPVHQLNYSIQVSAANIQATLYAQVHLLSSLAQVPLPPFLLPFHNHFTTFTNDTTSTIDISHEEDSLTDSLTQSSLNPYSQFTAAQTVLNRDRSLVQDELIQLITFFKICDARGVSLVRYGFDANVASLPTTFLASFHHSVSDDPTMNSQQPLPQKENDKQVKEHSSTIKQWYNETIRFSGGNVNTTQSNNNPSSQPIPCRVTTRLTNESVPFTVLVRLEHTTIIRLFNALQSCKDHCRGLMVKYTAQQPTLNQLFANAVDQ